MFQVWLCLILSMLLMILVSGFRVGTKSQSCTTTTQRQSGTSGLTFGPRKDIYMLLTCYLSALFLEGILFTYLVMSNMDIRCS